MKNPYKYKSRPIIPKQEAEILHNLYPKYEDAKLLVTSFPSPTKSSTNQKILSLKLLIGIFVGYILSFVLGFCVVKLPLQEECSISSISPIPVPPSKVVDPYTKKLKSNDKQLIFIGVMTANKYLDTRAKSAFETWGKTVPGSVVFYTSEHSSTNSQIPLVKLKGVDDRYPPQKKSFLMIKHMYDNHINDYEFFMRCDDDIFIRTERLEKFLKSLNSSRPLYIGQAGRGNSAEAGRLALKEEENFCMGGTGMIFSHTTLQMMAPNVKDCLKNLRSLHEDVEIGRCVQRFAGIPCTWSYEMSTIFFNNGTSVDSFTGSLKHKEVHRAITLHPIKANAHLHRVDAYIKGLILKEKETKLVQALRELQLFSQMVNVFALNFDKIEEGLFSNLIISAFGRKNSKVFNQRKLTPEWNMVSSSSYQFKDENPNHRATKFVQEANNDVIRDFMETIHGLSKELGRIMEFQELLYGYYRLSPHKSADYILDLLMLYRKYEGKKMTVTVRRHAYVEVPFGELHIKENTDAINEDANFDNSWTNYLNKWWKNGIFNCHSHNLEQTKISSETTVKKVKRIHFIIPLAGRFRTFQRFMDDYRRVCLEKDENVELIVVLFKPSIGEENSSDKVEELILSFLILFPSAEMKIIKSDTKFARASALELGTSECQPSDLLFLVDVDMTFNSETLDRIRWFTIRGRQVYYPIVFSEFDPKILAHSFSNHMTINDEVGYWRSYGFGIVSLYLSDLRNIGGFNTSIVGWGKEDIDLFDKVLTTDRLKVVRCSDPSLVHIFHSIECDPTTDPKQLAMCKGTKFNTYGSVKTLSKLLPPDLIQQLEEQPMIN